MPRNAFLILLRMVNKVMSIYPTIDQYLLSPCLVIIDEFNEKYQNISKKQLKQIADEKYNEMDICVRVGYPFKQMVHYTKGDLKKHLKTKINHDLFIELNDFRTELKFLKNWICSSGTRSASKNWKEIKADFDWTTTEIKNGNKGRIAFIIAWFNCVDYFSQLIQLGDGNTKGCKPIASEEKICYFPFLRKKTSPTYTIDLAYRYDLAYKPLQVNLIGEDNIDLNCIFLGKETDVFHFAIYF